MSRADIALRLPHPAARSGGVLLGCRSSPWLIGRRGGRPPPSDEETVVTSAAPTHQDLSHVYENLTAVIADVIAPGGGRGRPRPAPSRAPGIDALAAAGVLGAGQRHRGRRRRRRARRRRRGRRAASPRPAASTAMVVLMHYAAVAVIEAHGPRDVRREPRRGPTPDHAWRSPRPARAATSGRRRAPRRARRRRRAPRRAKSWVTSAGEADSYVWSSRPLGGRRADDAVAGARRRRRA